MFSKTTEYALRATFFIAQKGSKTNKLSIIEIAKAIGSPQPFTSKILQILTRDRSLVSSVRGPNGGFFMTEKAKKLPVSRILQVMHEEQTIKKCIMGLPQCTSEKPCPLHEQYLSIRNQLNILFETTTIGDIANNLNDQGVFLIDDKKKLGLRKPSL